MKFTAFLLPIILLSISCSTVSSGTEDVPSQPAIDVSTPTHEVPYSEIRGVDFRNFTYPWTKKLGYGEKTFTLKNGRANVADERKLSLGSVTYLEAADDYDEQAIVNVTIDSGNAGYDMVYVYAIENAQPKLLESFEFSEDTDNSFKTAFGAHGELILVSYRHQSGDAECCPSIIEVSYYRWQKNKFVLQDKPQQLSNGYVDRRRKRMKN